MALLRNFLYKTIAISLASVSVFTGCADSTQSSSASVTTATTSMTRLGETKATAIEVCKPQGQRAYLNHLKCPDGSAVEYERVRNVGERTEFSNDMSMEQSMALLERYMRYDPLSPGEVDHHMVDEYKLTCGTNTKKVYMDMYHCN